jgi:uncharacterized DUF497 family protein
MAMMRYEWDESKRLSNLRKHGFDFRDAHQIFDGPMLIRLDTRLDYDEDRWIGLGFLGELVVVVVYTEAVEDDRRRVISLRKALNYERKRFEEHLSNGLGTGRGYVGRGD